MANPGLAKAIPGQVETVQYWGYRRHWRGYGWRHRHMRHCYWRHGFRRCWW